MHALIVGTQPKGCAYDGSAGVLADLLPNDSQILNDLQLPA
jgi:hypothetical protein